MMPLGVNLSWSLWAQLRVLVSAVACTHHSTLNTRICSASGIDFCSLVFFLPNLCLSLFQSCASFLGLDQWSCIWPECANAGLNGAGRSGKTLNCCYFLWKISDVFFISLLLQLITTICLFVSGGSQWVFTVFPTFLKIFFSRHYDTALAPKSVKAAFLKKHRGWSFTSDSITCEVFSINCIQLN